MKTQSARDRRGLTAAFDARQLHGMDTVRLTRNDVASNESTNVLRVDVVPYSQRGC